MSENLLQSAFDIMVDANQYKTMVTTIQTLGKENSALKETIAQINEKIQHLANLQHDFSELKAKTKEESRMSLQNMKTLYSKLEDTEILLETSQKKIQNLQMDLKDKIVQLFLLNEQHQKIKKDYQNQQLTILNLTTQNEEKQSQIIALKAQNEEKQKQIITLNAQNVEKQNQIVNLDAPNHRLQQIINESVQKSSSNYQKVISDFRKTVKDLQQSKLKYKIHYNSVNNENKNNLARIKILQKMVAQKP